MKRSTRWTALAVIGLALAAVWVAWQFDSDIKSAHARSAQGSLMVTTRCGWIEYQEAGTGVPLLMVHGSGGGHDQGMAFAGKLAQRGIRVIAMSRFGYLRTPMPADDPQRRPMRMSACWTHSVLTKLRCWVALLAARRHCRWRFGIQTASLPWCCWCRWLTNPAHLQIQPNLWRAGPRRC